MKKSGGGGMLDGIKSKLGFADANQEYDDGYYDRGYDDRSFQDDFDGDYAGDYGEYGPDYREDASLGGDAPASKYDPYAPVTTRPARSSSRASARSAGFTPPKLVSIDDVRAHTQVPESLNRDPLPQRRVSSISSAASYRSDRTMVDAATSAPANTPNARAAAAQNRERSESLNSLFTSTAPDPVLDAAPAAAGARSNATVAMAVANPGAGVTAPAPVVAAAPARAITLLKPASYGEAERVAKALKEGDAVVIALRNTPDHLSKRILDFAFGVSCALDASVDCIADKVFVITRGAALSEAEKAALRNQGVL